MMFPFFRRTLLLVVLALPLPLAAQDVAPDVQAVISGPEDIAVGRTIVLEGTLSRTADQEVRHLWYVGEGTVPISRSIEALYTPEQPGELTFRLVMETLDRRQRSETTHTVAVYKRKVVVIADQTVTDDKLEVHRADAEDEGNFLRVIRLPESVGRLGSEDAMVQLMSDQRSAFIGAEAIVLWSDDIAVLQALMRAMRGDVELQAGVHNQTIVLITNRSLNTLARTAHGPFTVMQPSRILVTRREAINPLVTVGNVDQFLEELRRRDVDVLVVDAQTTGLRPWNVLSTLVNYMRTHGVSSEAVTLLLMLPFIATVLAFFKQVIGITTFGLYTPSIVALSFLALGWKVGLGLLVVILLTGYATRAFMRRWRLLYVPKVAIILTVVSLTLLILLGIAAYFEIVLSRDTIFILLIMSTLAESFLNLKTEEGWYSAMFGIGETIVAALVCVFLVELAVFQSVILAYPELILVTIVINVILGRWTGLRVVEYFRFREVFRHLQEE